MPEPISAELTKIALENLGELKQEKAKPSAYQIENSRFGQVFQETLNSQNTPQNPMSNERLMQIADSMLDKPATTMQAIPAGDIQLNVKQASEGGFNSGNGARDLLSHFFQDINNSQNNMDGMLARLNGGEKVSSQEMLTIQVFAHQHALTFETTAKAFEMFNNSVQKTINMQI